MATLYEPFGLSRAGYAAAAKPRESTYDFPIANAYAVSIGSGEPVSLSNGNIVVGTAPTAQPPNAQAELLLGVFQAVKYQPSQQYSPPATFPYWLANTQTLNAAGGIASVCIDPMQIYNVQANGALTAASVGLIYNLAGFGNMNAQGNSQVYLNSAGVVSGNTYGSVKVLGLAPVTPQIQALGGNSWSDQYPILQVVLNNCHLKYGQYGE